MHALCRATTLIFTLCQASCSCDVIIHYNQVCLLVAGTEHRTLQSGCWADCAQATNCKFLYLARARATTSRQTNKKPSIIQTNERMSDGGAGGSRYDGRMSASWQLCCAHHVVCWWASHCRLWQGCGHGAHRAHQVHRAAYNALHCAIRCFPCVHSLQSICLLDSLHFICCVSCLPPGRLLLTQRHLKSTFVCMPQVLAQDMHGSNFGIQCLLSRPPSVSSCKCC